MKLRDKRILVTGATGFIGGRLAERLVIEEKGRVRALVRNFSTAAWLARLPVEIVKGDVTNPEVVRQACDGCDIVFHCAHSASGDYKRDRVVNVYGTENVLRASIEAGVKRFIHMSTVSVMGPRPADGADENSPVRFWGDSYSDTKLEGELKVLECYRECNAPVAVIRPTIVYGPRSPSWTLAPLKRIQQGREVLINGGLGLCNSLYVDNLVDALLLSTTATGIEGEIFIISDGQPLPWREFLGYYTRWVGTKLRSLPASAAHVTALAMDAWEWVANRMAIYFLQLESPKIVNGAISFSRQTLFPGLPRLTHAQIDFFANRAAFNTTKAQQRLGYVPRISLEKGMGLTKQWLLEQGYLSFADEPLEPTGEGIDRLSVSSENHSVSD